MKPGSHTVVLRRAGFLDWTRTIDAPAAGNLSLRARLDRVVPGPVPVKHTLRSRGWVRTGDLVALGPGVTPPRRIAGEPARYPATARRMRLQGTVTAEFTVTETGTVAEARIVQSAGETLDDAMLAAVGGWRYQPGDQNGVKVKVRLRERQSFSGDAR